jgi:hypothetical protein
VKFFYDFTGVILSHNTTTYVQSRPGLRGPNPEPTSLEGHGEVPVSKVLFLVGIELVDLVGG